MNSLVGSGLIAAFALGAFTAVYPDALGPNAGSLFEEPVLLLAFVMLGRALESARWILHCSRLSVF